MDFFSLAMQDQALQIELANEGIFLSKYEGTIVLTYHLTGEVTNPKQYVKLLEMVRCLSSKDVFEIVISGSPGGYLHGARVLTTAMDSTEAWTKAVVISDIASAATMPAINADELVMTKGSSMMLHTASYGSIGKSGEIEAHVAFNSIDIRETLNQYYNTFLSKKEINSLLKNQDIYLTADECTERFKKVIDKREKAYKKYEKEAKKAQRILLREQLAALEED